MIRLPHESIREARRAYETAAERLVSRTASDHPDQVLYDTGRIARMAWFSHTGRFFDGVIENLALDIGQRLDDLAPPHKIDDRFAALSNAGKRRVLHVVTTLLPIGGHSRGVCNWVTEDTSSEHSVIILSQYGFPIRDELFEGTNSSPIIVPDGTTPLGRAQWLRAAARLHDLVILHTDPDDTIPVAALASSELPPVALLNHADHVFWVGGTVADVVINIRQVAQDLTIERRPNRLRSQLLLSPVRPKAVALSQFEAKAHLGIRREVPLILSIGSAYKFAPSKGLNFFRAVGQVLDALPQAQCVLVGPDANDLPQYATPIHPRISAVGIQADPSPWQSAADVVLDPFPFGSVTALLESLLAGCYPILSPLRESPIVTAGSDAIREHCGRATSESDWVRTVTAALNQPSPCALRAMQDSILRTYQGPQWLRAAESAYTLVQETGHAPDLISRPEALATPDDLAVATMQSQARQWLG